MKFTGDKVETGKAVKAVAGIPSRGMKQSIYEHIVMRLTPAGVLELHATDTVLYATAFMPVTGSDGSDDMVAIKADHLKAFFDGLGRTRYGPSYEAKLNKAKWNLQIDDGKGDGDLRGVDPSPFILKAYQPAAEEITVTLPLSELRDMVHHVEMAVSKDIEPLFVLTGIYFEITGGTLTLVASDTRRVATVFNRKVDASADTHVVLIGTMVAKAMAILKALSISQEVTLHIMADESVWMTTDNVHLYLRPIHSQPYPPYRSLYPTKMPTMAVADSRQMLSAVEFAALFNPGRTELDIYHDGTGGVMQVSSAPSDAGDTVHRLPVELTGEPASIVLDPILLKQHLQCFVDSGCESIRVMAAPLPEAKGTQIVLSRVDSDEYRVLMNPILTLTRRQIGQSEAAREFSSDVNVKVENKGR